MNAPTIRLTLVASLFLTSVITAEEPKVTITIEEMPTSTEEFVALRNETATTPEGAVIFCLALIKLVENEELESNSSR